MAILLFLAMKIAMAIVAHSSNSDGGFTSFDA